MRRRNQAVPPDEPTISQLETEFEREKQKRTLISSFFSTIGIMIVAGAVAVLASDFLLPVFRVKDSSMAPYLKNGEIAVAVSSNLSGCSRGDAVAFWYGNSVLFKRIIACGGDEIDVRPDGSVILNGVPIDEPYAVKASPAEPEETDAAFPLKVPDGCFFVLSDDRSNTVDSRNSLIGCIRESRIEGRVLFGFRPPLS